MEVKKLDVFEALETLGAYRDVWVSVEELVQRTNLSDKWVRESLNRLEIAGLVSVKVGKRGVRLYQLNSKVEPTGPFMIDNQLARPAARREIVEIGKTPVGRMELPKPPPIPALIELDKRKPEIRKILKNTSTEELKQIFDHLNAKRAPDRNQGNPFEAVTMFATNGLIDSGVEKVSIERAVIIGTASTAQAQGLGFRFGNVSIPVRFGLMTACGLIRQIVKDKVEHKKDIKVPKKHTPDRVDTDVYAHDEFPGMNKILKETFHYGLDHETLDYALPFLRQRLHYRTDLESVEYARVTNPGGPRLFLLKSGSLTPQEQHPLDFRDPNKARYLQIAFDQYLRLKDRIVGRGGDSLVFGVIEQSEARRSIFREIVDEILGQKLPGWESGRMSALDDNRVLGMLLEPGEVTPVIEKTPMEDILNAIGRTRVRSLIGGAAAFNQYETYRQQSKTYQFYMGFGTGIAVRFDSPVFLDTKDEAIEIRDLASPVLYSLSSMTDESDGVQLPRIVKYAENESRQWLATMAKMLPSWLGGKLK